MRTRLNTSGRVLDDYLSLLQTDLASTEIVVVTGPSGSGKTSQIRLLLAEHNAYRHIEPVWIRTTSPNFSWNETRRCDEYRDPDLLVIDEILSPLDLFRAWPFLKRARRVLVASHLPAFLMWFTRRSLVHVETGSSIDKLKRFMDRLNIAYTVADLSAYVRRYGPVYTELQIMLEACPGTDLGHISTQFHRRHRISRRRRMRSFK